jgi:hypothetical protein
LADAFPAAAHGALLAETELVIPLLVSSEPIGASGGRHRGDLHPGLMRATTHEADHGEPLAVAIVVGGEDVGVPYGVAQETKDYAHPHGGERYFFSDAIRAEAPLFTNRVGGRLQPLIETLGGGQ